MTTETLFWPTKHPDEVLDYTIDWSSHLGSDTISTATFTVDTSASGVVKNSSSKTDTTATVWLSGGNPGASANVYCVITTSGGRTIDENVILPIASP